MRLVIVGQCCNGASIRYVLASSNHPIHAFHPGARPLGPMPQDLACPIYVETKIMVQVRYHVSSTLFHYNMVSHAGVPANTTTDTGTTCDSLK